MNGSIVFEMKAPTSKAPAMEQAGVCTEAPFTCDPPSQMCGSICPCCPFTWKNRERCHSGKKNKEDAGGEKTEKALIIKTPAVTVCYGTQRGGV